MVAPVIIAFGSPAQQQRFLPRILAVKTGGARVIPSRARLGSRLAQDPRRATGDHYVVNGAKTWNTLGQTPTGSSAWCAPIERAEAAAGHLLPAHRHEVAGHHRRPIVTMDGAHEVNEVGSRT